MNKNNSGFSLVELIVVIAIMAILAGIAVPTYSKYIAKANNAAVMAEPDVVKTAAFAVAAADGKAVETIKVTSSSITVTCVKGNSEQTATTYYAFDLEDFLDDTTVTLTGSSYEETGMTWSGGTWENIETE